MVPKLFPFRPFRLLPALLVAAVGVAPVAAVPLSLEERVAAQDAIEAIYQSHRTGTAAETGRAVPVDVLERKVSDYLLRSAALERFWNTPVTAEALDREMHRIARGTLFPDRLEEIYRALNHDAFLIQETFARAALTQRLSRNFFAYDDRIHGPARAEAESVRGRLLRGRIDPSDPRWTVVEAVRRTLPGGADPLPEPGQPEVLELGSEEFERWTSRVPRRAGEVGPVVEHREAFTIQILLDGGAGFARVGTYTVPKRSWDDWWAEVSPSLRQVPVPPVASISATLPRSASLASTEGGGGCSPADVWNNGVLDDIPEPRLNHTAIWTGTEVIVWGGSGIAPQLGTGGRYDPLTDTWLPISPVGAPSARRLHTAVWTGTEMIVWGGTDGLELGDGGRYDPATDTWATVSGTFAPGPRTGHSAVWTGTEMIIWGGVNQGGGLLTGGRYNPVTDSWTPTGTTNVPFPRAGHVAVWTGSLMVIWGGSAGGAVSSGGRYDPVADTWTSTSTVDVPQARTGHTAIWTGTEMIVWGGVNLTDLLNSGGRYDPATDTWTAPTRLNAPAGRRDHTAVWTGSEMIVWAGSSGSLLNTGGIYDPATDSWTPTGSSGVPSPRTLHTSTWTGNVMVSWGGSQAQGLNTTGGRFNPVSNDWTPTASANGQSGRKDHTAVWTGSEMMVWGGFNSVSPNYLQTGGRYDPVIDDWMATSMVGPPEGRELHLTAWTGSRMLIWGGFNGTVYVNTGGVYDPLSDSWTPITTSGAPGIRQGPTGVWTGTEFIVWGGFNTVYLKDGARYDPATDTWAPVTGVNAPLERFLHSAVWTGTEMLLWGGTSTVSVTSTGARYDPATDTWTNMTFTGPPSSRNRHTAVWTGSQMIVWGGFDGFTYFDTGGRYDPATDTWSPMSTTNAPAGRLDHTAVWSGGFMLVWGGFDGSPSFPYLGTGGRYDPALDAWDPIALVDAPSPRNDHTAVWIGDSMVVWGGSDGSVLNTGGRYAIGDTPGEATALSFAPDAATLSWTAASGTGVSHELLRGLAAELPVGSGVSETCVGSGLGTSTADATVPGLGSIFWYLPRGANACGIGTYGVDSSGFERTSSACP